MPGLVGTNLVLQGAAGANGGASTGTALAKNLVNTWVPNVTTLSTGTLDTNAVTGYGLAYAANLDTNTASSYLIWGDNLISPITTAGPLSLAMTDTGGYTLVYGVASGATAASSETVAWTGATIATQTSWSRIFLIVHVDVNGNLGPVTTEAVTCSVGSQAVTVIPAGYSYATGEVSLWPAPAKGNQSTFSGDPSGGGTWTQPNTSATGLYVVSSSTTFATGEVGGLYARVIRQPGAPQIYGPTGCLISWNLQAVG